MAISDSGTPMATVGFSPRAHNMAMMPSLGMERCVAVSLPSGAFSAATRGVRVGKIQYVSFAE